MIKYNANKKSQFWWLFTVTILENSFKEPNYEERLQIRKRVTVLKSSNEINFELILKQSILGSLLNLSEVNLCLLWPISNLNTLRTGPACDVSVAKLSGTVNWWKIKGTFIPMFSSSPIKQVYKPKPISKGLLKPLNGTLHIVNSIGHVTMITRPLKLLLLCLHIKALLRKFHYEANLERPQYHKRWHRKFPLGIKQYQNLLKKKFYTFQKLVILYSSETGALLKIKRRW